MPGRAAIVTVLTILLTYLLVAIAAMMYAGVGAEGLGLGNEETSSDVFGALAEPVMGQWPSLLLFLAVVTSSLASLQTTFLPPARTLLAMGEYQAIPTRFAHVHPRFQIPSYATLACGIATGAFYTIMTRAGVVVLTLRPRGSRGARPAGRGGRSRRTLRTDPADPQTVGSYVTSATTVPEGAP